MGSPGREDKCSGTGVCEKQTSRTPDIVLENLMSREAATLKVTDLGHLFDNKWPKDPCYLMKLGK